MTQYPTPSAVKGRFDNVSLAVKDGSLVLRRKGREFWVDFLSSTDSRLQRRRIGMLTGSHHMQVYWLEGVAGGPVDMLPYVFLLGDRRWVPAQDTFLSDPRRSGAYDSWNARCIQCHATAGQPRPVAGTQPMRMDTRTAELGIACEACHGPGERHVIAHSNRPAGQAAQADTTIVNPARLSARRSAQVCGQCHAFNAMTDYPQWLQNGSRYRPGDDLDEISPLVLPGAPSAERYVDDLLKAEPDYLVNRFWSDGMVRVAGREWNGLARSACHLKGNASCISCHDMHGAPPADQLRQGHDGDAACAGCHQEIASRMTEHTHHPAESSGSRCMNCHMPYTSFGLLKAVRSHEIDSPDARSTLETGRPNACNLCHLDQTLAWAAEGLWRWWGRPVPPLAEKDRQVSAGVLWMLEGDAGQRALAAWSLGWRPAREASGPEWIPTFLSLALNDNYSAVRYIAARSLREFAEYARMRFDYVANPQTIERQVGDIIKIWARTRGPIDPEKAMRLLLKPDGSLMREEIEKHLTARNERALNLQE